MADDVKAAEAKAAEEAAKAAAAEAEAAAKSKEAEEKAAAEEAAAKAKAEAEAADADAESDAGNGEDGSGKETDKDGKDGADDDNADDDDNDDDGLKWDDVQRTGDEVADSVLSELQEAGISTEDAKALIYDPLLEHGDPTKIDRDALIEKVGKARANLVMAGIENYVGRNNAAAEEAVGIVYETAGGKEGWEKVAAWARENVSDKDRADLNALMDQGGRKASFAASEYVRMHNEAEGTTSVGRGETLEGDAKAGDVGEAISRVEYAERMEKAHRLGPKPGEIAAIQRARERGRKKGL